MYCVEILGFCECTEFKCFTVHVALCDCRSSSVKLVVPCRLVYDARAFNNFFEEMHPDFFLSLQNVKSDEKTIAKVCMKILNLGTGKLCYTRPLCKRGVYPIGKF